MEGDKPLYELAYVDYQNGMKYKEIADKYNVSVGTVNSWKSRYSWRKPMHRNVHKKEKKLCIEKNKKGGQPNNKNAVGNSGGAPDGNKNNLQHGAYESVYWDSLNETERGMIDAMEFNEEEKLLTEQIQLLTVRERRLLHRIKVAEEKKGGLALDSVTKKLTEADSGGTQTETTTHTISTFEVIQKLESELTKVQARKTDCIKSLDKTRIGREELDMKKRVLQMKEKEMDKRNGSVDDNELKLTIDYINTPEDG